MAGYAEKIRVLIVDDNATNREILAAQLRAWGMIPNEAPDGAAALQKLEQSVGQGEPYRLVILDMQMPEMDGLAVGAAIRRDARFKTLPLIMITAHADHEAREKAMAAGARAFIQKPFEAGTLLSAIRAALNPGDTAGMSDNTMTEPT